jgi:integrase
MPKVIDKRKVLGGRGSVVLYGSGTSTGKYFYRELIKGTKNYKTKRIDGVTNMDEAEAACVEIAIELNKEQSPLDVVVTPNKELTKRQDYSVMRVVTRKPRSIPIAQAVKNWLKMEYEKADAGLITKGTADAKERLFRLYVLPFLEEKNITLTSQINNGTFEDYPVYRSNTTALKRQNELKMVKEWCRNYLVRNRYLNSEVLLDKLTPLIPRTTIKQTDLMKNPAINPDDWKIIVDYVRDEWKQEARENIYKKQGWYFRNVFHHFILFAKNSGMSPEEILKLKWKQIEIVDEGRLNSKGEMVSWEVAYVRTIRSKTQQPREIPVNQARELRRWKEWIEKYIEKNDFMDRTITKEDYVFGNPHHTFRPYSYVYFSNCWRTIRRKLKGKLSGHRFSPHPYTIYSMRSTFIEDQLIKGTPVMEVAEMAGHDVRETQRTYARLNLRRKGRELTLPIMGKKQTFGTSVDLFTEK